MTADKSLNVDHFIELDRQSIRYQVVAGVVLLAAGAVVMLGGFGKMASVGGYDLDTITKASGCLVSLVGLFPFNNCWARWERIKTLRAIQHDPDALDSATRNELVKKLYSKFLEFDDMAEPESGRPASATAEPLDRRIERANRTALVRTVVLSLATVVAAAAFLWFIVNEANRANDRLHGLNDQIATANQAAAAASVRLAAANAEAAAANEKVAAAEAARTKAEADLKTALEALTSATDQATKMKQQIGELESKLAELQKALADALDLQKHVYKLNWDELKMIAMESGGAAQLLEKISQQKDRVRWGMSNTAAGGYNSPGFATLILQQSNRLPAGKSLGDLPRDDGPPRLGDVVLYESGYALFFFRDHLKREFVIGMTPSGVTALNYDFGVKRISVLRTGFSNR